MDCYWYVILRVDDSIIPLIVEITDEKKMIRATLPPSLHDYYNDIDTVEWDMSAVSILEKKKFLFGLFTRTLYRIPDAYHVRNKQEDIYVYHYTVGKKRPTVFCAPILGGDLKQHPDGKYKGSFPIAKLNAFLFSLINRWNCVIVCTNNKALFDDSNTPQEFELELKNVAYNNIQTVQFIKSLPDTDIDKIYAIGVSLGGLTVTCMSAIEDSFKIAVIIMAGSPLSYVIAHSTENSVKRFFTRLMRDMSLTHTELANDLQKHIITDPFILSTYIPNDTAFMVIAEHDTSVPTISQKQLWGHVKPNECWINKFPKYFQWLSWFEGKGWLSNLARLANGHYLTVFAYPYVIIRSMLFFKKIRHK
jgi:hypothetical protein